MGFIGIFVHQLIQVHGINLTTAVRAGWLISLIPIWSAVLGAAFLGERFGGLKVAGLIVGLAGALLVVTRGEITAGVLVLPETRGDLLILASTFNWAIYSVVGRGTLKRLGSARATAAAITIGSLMLSPLFIAQAGWRELPTLSSAALAAVLFLGIGCSGLAYWFWYAALERLETAEVAAFLYLEPLFTLAAAMAVLREPVAATTILGGLAVLVGVALVQRRGQAGA
jgi:drug/metabolite transporter (DMT)-like permease